MQRWRTRLEAAGDLLARLRGSVTPVFANTARPALPAIEAIEGDLDLLAQLVGEDDAEVNRWRTQARNSRQRIAELRERLQSLHAALPDDGVATAAQLAAGGPRTEELAVLAGPGDEQVAQWQLLLRDSQAQLNAWQAQLNERLDPAAGHRIGLAEQAILQTLRQRLIDKAAADLDRLSLWDERLRQEAERVTALRRSLAEVMDAPQPFSSTTAAELEQFLRDAGADDDDARRWAAKATRIRQLRDELAVLDERRSVPDGVVALFERLALEVGDQAPEIQRWQEKVRTIERTMAALAPLDGPASLPEEVDVLLARLARLVGDDDAGLRRYSDKVARIRSLGQGLTALAQRPTLGPDDLAAAHEDLRTLVSLVGIADATAVAAARRVTELDGPPIPSWAENHGRDDSGRWAAFSYAGIQQRMRYIAPGSFLMGSPADEPGRDDDETAVPVRLSRGYWLAETETTQALWTAVIGSNPSRFVDPERPVERVSRQQALTFLERLGERMPGLRPRLPSEAEWEMAARAGHPGRWWLPPGDQRLEAIAWHAANSRRASQVVGGRYPNPLGLYDMHGNVSEWVADTVAAYPTTAITDPLARGAGLGLARGGSWGDPPATLRAANRIPVRADMTSAYLGLRLAAPADWADDSPDGSALLASADPQQHRELHLSWGPLDLRLRLPRINGLAIDAEPLPSPPADGPQEPDGYDPDESPVDLSAQPISPDPETTAPIEDEQGAQP